MLTINVEEEAKEKFKLLKLRYSAKIGKELSEDEFMGVLLENFEVNK
ncbi:MAG: hypothetical protein AABY22_00790 [Nanoarchaeota archaeon]